MLFKFTSEFRKTPVKVYMIKVDVELVRLGILVNGKEVYRNAWTKELTSAEIEDLLVEMLKFVISLTRDFPESVYNDIISGRFTKRMQRYQQLWKERRRPPGFGDYGEVTIETSFEQMVVIYE